MRAPQRPVPDAQLVTKLIKRPFLKCSSHSCGSLEVLNDPATANRITFTSDIDSGGPGMFVDVTVKRAPR